MTDRSSKRPAISVRGLLAATLFTCLLLCGMGVYSTTALVSIPPIGAIPNGVTLWVWRTDAMRLVDSPDAMCGRHMGGVSLLCRGAAIAAVSYKIIARFPYSESLYRSSTGGQTYEDRPRRASGDPATPPDRADRDERGAASE